MFHTHWGIILDTEVPTTGVYNGNVVDLEWEDAIDPEGDALTCGWCGDEIEEDTIECPHCGKDVSPNDFDLGYYAPSTLLYGNWKRNEEDGLWEPDRTGEWAAIWNADGNTLQVVWSKWLSRGKMCSPCYPGQVDAETDDYAPQQQPPPGEQQLYYALPPEMFQS